MRKKIKRYNLGGLPFGLTPDQIYTTMEAQALSQGSQLGGLNEFDQARNILGSTQNAINTARTGKLAVQTAIQAKRAKELASTAKDVGDLTSKLGQGAVGGAATNTGAQAAAQEVGKQTLAKSIQQGAFGEFLKTGAGGAATAGLGLVGKYIQEKDKADGTYSKAGAMAGGALQGASLGAALGPLGMLAGGAIGAGVGVLQKEKFEQNARAEELTKQTNEARKDVAQKLAGRQILKTFPVHGIKDQIYAHGGEHDPLAPFTATAQSTAQPMSAAEQAFLNPIEPLVQLPMISQGNFDVDEEGNIIEDQASVLDMMANPMATLRTVVDPSVKGRPSQVEFDKAAGKGTVAGTIANDIVNPAAWVNYGATAVGDVGRAGQAALQGNAMEALGHMGSAGMNALGTIPGISPSAAAKAAVRKGMTQRGMVGLSDWRNLTPNPYGFREVGAKPNVFGQYPMPKDPMKMDLESGFKQFKQADERFWNEGAKKGLFSDDFNIHGVGREYMESKTPLGKNIGSGSFGRVYEFGANPNFAVKVGALGQESRYGGVTQDFLNRVLPFAKESNIAVPLRFKKFEAPSPNPLMKKIHGDMSPMEVSVMRNLNRQSSRGALDLYDVPNAPYPMQVPSRDAYALAKKQVRALRDKGIALDIDNPENLRFNPRTGKFDIFDLENVPQLTSKTQQEKELWDGLTGKHYNAVEYTDKVNDFINNSYSDYGIPQRAYGGHTNDPDYLAEGGEMVQHAPGDRPLTNENGNVTPVTATISRITGDKHSAPSGGVGMKGQKPARIYSDQLHVPEDLIHQLSKL